LKEALEKCELKESYEEFKQELIKLSGLKGKNFFMPLRIVLTGSTHGPELNELYPHLKPFIKELARKA
ncbi:MAG: glutamate--tRNA ligase, partial [Campylobacter upsaliensis]